ncbi:MAG: hypothetical protein ABIH18_10045 [Candidatus Omnitrophota bacterium]
MEKENITPEEKLLKIIESPGIQKQKSTPAQSKRNKNAGISVGWLKKFNIDREKLKNFNLKTANKISIGICVVFTVFGVSDFLKFKIQLDNRYQKIINGIAVSPGEPQKLIIPDVKLKILQEEIKKRNIFTFLPKPEIVEAAGTNDEIANLKLVGVIWSDNPQAMIEDLAGKRTYLVNQGEKIGELKVKKILKEKVILGKEDKEWQLR